MQIFYLFLIVFIALFLFSTEQINYTINSSSINIDYCNSDKGLILFQISGKIHPKPYCDMKFNLSLSEPPLNTAECIIFDDINNKINCSFTFSESFKGIIKIKKQIIELNTYKAYISLLDFANNSINIKCYSLYIAKKIIIKIVFVLFIFI